MTARGVRRRQSLIGERPMNSAARERTMRGMDLTDRVRRKAGKLAVQAFFSGAARLGRLHPRARAEHHGVEVIIDRVVTAPGSVVRRCSTFTAEAFRFSPRTRTG
jgi:hypothetical protein